MKPRFFRSSREFRAWLEKHHSTERELVLGFYKVSSGKGGLTHQQALDEALCFGWIDGMVKNLAADCYTIRFSQRRSGSHWSRINIKRAHELTAAGLMHDVGLAAFKRRDESKTINYSYELSAAKFTPALERQFKANKAAWHFFTAQAPSYQRHAKFFVMSAKREETREKRIGVLIAHSEAGRRLSIVREEKDKART